MDSDHKVVHRECSISGVRFGNGDEESDMVLHVENMYMYMCVRKSILKFKLQPMKMLHSNIMSVF